jgi:hypothetical protein
MTLSTTDEENADFLRNRFKTCSRAGAVSIALEVTRHITEIATSNDELLVHYPHEEKVQAVSILGLTH